ncbi:MAG: hypothetical protein ACQETH_06585 [Candidatus Rifleibacteriota bacterium]
MKTFFKITVCLSIIFSFTLPAFCKNFDDIQIFFPGNLRGKAVELDNELNINFSSCFKAPDLIKALSKKDTNLVISPGNNSSIYHLPSFLINGKAEKEVLSRCNPRAMAPGPADLMIYRNQILPVELRKQIISNFEPDDGHNIFTPFVKIRLKGTNFWIFNFIDTEAMQKLPLRNWGKLIPENSQRALRRIAPEIENKDIVISIAHLPKEKCYKLVKELNQWPGNHLLVQVPLPGEKADFSTYNPELIDKVFVFSLSEGEKRLPLVKLIRRNFARPRLTIRRLPYNKFSSRKNNNRRLNKILSQALYETLAFIPVTLQPSTTAFRFSPALHAEFVRSYMSSDIAIVFPPKEKFKNDNVISVADCLTSFANERCYRFRISGKELLKLLNKIVKFHGSQMPQFAGISFRIFSGEVRDLSAGNIEILPQKLYNISVNHSLATKPYLKEFNLADIIKNFNGTTLWDIWKNQLKSLRMKKEHFFETY